MHINMTRRTASRFVALGLGVAVCAVTGGSLAQDKPALCSLQVKEDLKQSLQNYFKALEEQEGRKLTATEKDAVVNDVFANIRVSLEQKYVLVD